MTKNINSKHTLSSNINLQKMKDFLIDVRTRLRGTVATAPALVYGISELPQPYQTIVATLLGISIAVPFHHGINKLSQFKKVNKNKQKNIERLQSILSNLPAINFFIIDTDGYYHEVNENFAQSLGKQRNDIKGKHISEIFLSKTPQEIEKILENNKEIRKDRHFKTSNKEEEQQISLHDGKIHTLKTFKTRYDCEGQKCILGVSTDITELIVYQQQLEETLEELQQQNQELEETKNHVEKANKFKSEVVSNISHEIRNPLNGVIGFTKLLKENFEKNTLEDIPEVISALSYSSDQLSIIINDFLDLSKLQSGKLNFQKQTFNPSETITKLIATNQLLFSKEQQKVELKIDPSLLYLPNTIGDAGRINQIINNFISNAKKFTKSGSIIVGAEHHIEGKNLEITYRVKDTGIGIPRDKLHTIFERFTQATDSTSKKFGGTGLGLAIVKEFCEKMGGNAWAESIEGEGSTFYAKMKLPLAENTEIKTNIVEIKDSKVEKNPETLDLYGKKVLIVDDERANQMLAEGLLENTGAIIEFANNGQEAIEKAKIGNFDLILMDIRMPLKNGFEATREIRKFSSLPIIAVSANTDDQSMQDAQFSGMNDFVEKPINIKKLFSSIRTQLGL